MANNKSSLKRIRITERNRLQNRFYKGNVRKLTKLFYAHLESYKISQNHQDKQKIEVVLSELFSFIDKGQKKNVFHINTASRKKAVIASKLKTTLNEML
jgi:small subunit ribosomal protein S20